MIAILSQWELKNGCPVELVEKLEQLGARVRAEEPGTLEYSIHVPGSVPPIGPAPDYEVYEDPEFSPEVEANKLVFFEIYENAEAFRDHLKGSAARFMEENRTYFKTPWQGYPRPEVLHLDPKFFFARAVLSGREGE